MPQYTPNADRQHEVPSSAACYGESRLLHQQFKLLKRPPEANETRTISVEFAPARPSEESVRSADDKQRAIISGTPKHPARGWHDSARTNACREHESRARVITHRSPSLVDRAPGVKRTCLQPMT
jgi:hypothetical protein